MRSVRDAVLAAEDMAQDQRARRHQLADAERDHGEGVPARRVDTAPKMMPKTRPATPPTSGNTTSGSGAPLPSTTVHHVHGQEAAQPEEDGVAERQQAGLAEQHVVGQREDDHRSPSGTWWSSPVRKLKTCGSTGQDDGGDDPDAVAGDEASCAGPTAGQGRGISRRRS